MIESYPAYARNYSGHCNVPSCTLISKNSSSGARFASRIAALANHFGRGRERTRRRKPRFQTSTKASRYRKGSTMSPYGGDIAISREDAHPVVKGRRDSSGFLRPHQ